jgi:hypothetical protein
MSLAKLRVDRESGHMVGRKFSYNQPFPTRNGTPNGGASSMMGVVMHTMDGTYGGTISWFNNPDAEASADFAISNEGLCHQFGPIGKNWMAWAQAAGNPYWYSIEFEDDEDPSKPLTEDQINAAAQIVEALSAFADFPLERSDSTSVKGFGTHSMGGVPWGNHPNCPGNVRANQRDEILRRAKEIRSPAPAAAPSPSPAPAPTPTTPTKEEAQAAIKTLTDYVG